MANLRTNNLSGEQGQNAYRGSVFFDGSSSFLSFNAAIWNSTASDSCTFECWLWVTDLSTARNIFDLGSTGDFSIQTDGQIRIHPVSSNWMDTNNSITTQSWHHIALVQESGRKDVYINGVKSSMTVGGGDPVASNWANTNANTFNLGDDGVYRDFFRGYMSNVRVLKGVALYDNDFTPPFTELKATDSNTSLLCCQNSDDVTQEETGKTITGNGNLATAGYNKTQPKVIPPYGVDAGNAFGGPIQQSSQGYMYFPTGRTEERGRGRGLCAGGSNPDGLLDNISFVEIATQGNAVEFGDLTLGTHNNVGVGSKVRGVFSFGHAPVGTALNTMEFVTIATTANSIDFGDTSFAGAEGAGCSNDVRGLMFGGYNFTSSSNLNNIDFITIASLGNGSDFGDILQARRSLSSCASPTRGLLAGGYAQPDTATYTNAIEFITIASAGNAQDFGDLTRRAWGMASCSSSTRGTWSGGMIPTNLNTIDFVTIATAGNALDFGDMTLISGRGGATSNATRGVIFHGHNTSTYVNNIDFITIATTGNASDFGDNTFKPHGEGATSDSHGGLS